MSDLKISLQVNSMYYCNIFSHFIIHTPYRRTLYCLPYFYLLKFTNFCCTGMTTLHTVPIQYGYQNEGIFPHYAVILTVCHLKLLPKMYKYTQVLPFQSFINRCTCGYPISVHCHFVGSECTHITWISK